MPSSARRRLWVCATEEAPDDSTTPPGRRARDATSATATRNAPVRITRWTLRAEVVRPARPRRSIAPVRDRRGDAAGSSDPRTPSPEASPETKGRFWETRSSPVEPRARTLSCRPSRFQDGPSRQRRRYQTWARCGSHRRGGTRAKQWRRTGQPLCRTPKSRSPTQHVCGQGSCSAPSRDSFLAHRYRCEVAGLLPGICLDLGFASGKESLFSERLSERPTSACFGTCGKNCVIVPVCTCNVDLVRSDMHSQSAQREALARDCRIREAREPAATLVLVSAGSRVGVPLVSDCGGATASASDPRGPAPADSPTRLTIRLRFRGVITYVAEQRAASRHLRTRLETCRARIPRRPR